MIKRHLTLTIIITCLTQVLWGQANVPILSYDVNNLGQVQLEINGSSDKYYMLTAQHAPNFDYETITSMTLGVDGSMIISEPLEAYDLERYRVTEFDVNAPADTDFDNIDDISEFNDMPTKAPLNYAREIPIIDGTASIPTPEVFSELGVVSTNIPWAPFLNNQEFVKFAIVNQSSDEPEIYFINSNTHYIHADFLNTINVDQFGDDVTTGEIVYNPNVVHPNGAFGSYSFNYSFGDAFNFETTRTTFELLARNMPFLDNNFQHFISSNSENQHNNFYADDFVGSRINVVFESEFFEDVDYLPFNQAEGYGFFRQMTLDENPNSRDIVLYDALPNSLPRVGGIITSVIQTPLSHVNLRAIQDNVPNAYINEPLEIDSIANLLGKYIYYKVEQEQYFIREASLEEVNEWYEKLRPTEDQIPERDLSQTDILPLDEIEFEMSNAFGAKCANVATMRDFGFPEGTIPNGFGIPFYYYDEFMKFNGFYEDAQEMLNDPDFKTDLETRIDMLDDFRKDIRDGDMPQWMLDNLQIMHDAFPEGTSVRVRSSTNNEDLPGFSGAGLYTSKTQHPDEGHMSKSVKQVYASMWNFRAYDERDFYRVDHFIAAMGLLCHPNYNEEKSNGVGVSIDPIYQTAETFYLNTQVGEFLITNPDENSIPEEILLSENADQGYFVLRYSNLVEDGELVMEDIYLDQLREYLRVIHDEFAILYNVVGAEGFGMDIEYKVTAEDQLIIKQARPWVSFWAEINANFDLAVQEISQPVSSASLGEEEYISATVANEGLRNMSNFELSLLVDGEVVETIEIADEIATQESKEYQFATPQDLSEIGDYNIGAAVYHPEDGFDRNDTLQTIVSKVHLLEGGLTIIDSQAKCGEEVEVTALVNNYGEESFYNTKIEVVSNGVAVDIVEYTFNIPSFTEVEIDITVTENLMADNNVIELNLISLNDVTDAIPDNNTDSAAVSLETEFDIVTLVINPDNYPEETSWAIINESNGEFVASGGLSSGDTFYSEDICVNYGSCYVLYVYDAYSDGICCFFGEGNFSLLNAAGEELLFNDGDFGAEAVEPFCPGGDCLLNADIETIEASSEFATDGSIIINASNGEAPYEYSINGGQSFVSTNTFDNLIVGEYEVVVRDASENCTYEQTIELGFITSNDNIDITSKITLAPNPTNGEFVVSATALDHITDDIQIKVFNSLGKLIIQDALKLENGNTKTTLSLNNQAAGHYYVKCYNKHFESNFKLFKI